MTQAYGGKLRSVLAQNTSNRFKSFATGFTITALLQSSTATILMALSFVQQSLIALPMGIAIVMGADLSTTIVAQVLSLDISWLSPFLIIIGYVLAVKSERGSKGANIGHMITGLGLILLALALLRDSIEPLRDAPLLVQMLDGLRSEPVLAIAFSAILAVILHSSLAAILFYSSMAVQGIIPLELSILLVLGTNIGSSFIPFMLTYGNGGSVRRITTVNLLLRGVLTVVSVLCIPLIVKVSFLISENPAQQIVNLHTGLNLAIAVLFLPFVGTLTKLSYKLIKPGKGNRSDNGTMYLDETALDKPTIALAGAARETLRMADLVENMTEQVFEAMKAHNQALLNEVKERDNKLNELFGTIKIFLARLKHDALNSEETLQVQRILTFATNLEHCGDIIKHSLYDTVHQKIEAQDLFSPEGWEEIKTFHKAVVDNMQIAQSVFISQSIQLAGEMIETKKRLKHVEFDSRRKHFNRLSQQQPQTLATSGIHVDLMRDLGRINSYMTAIAYETMNG